MKYLYLACLFLSVSSSLFAMDQRLDFLLVAPKEFKSAKVHRYPDKFSLSLNDKEFDIENHMVSTNLRNVEPKKLAVLLKSGCAYLQVNQCSDGSFSLDVKGRINGGGAIGCAIGCFLGKAAVSLVGHGTIAVTSLIVGTVTLNPVTGWGTAIVLESWFGHMIEVASIKGAVVGGIMGGVATGPI